MEQLLTDSRYRVLAIASHPVQYMSPLFRKMAEHPQLDLQVAYCTLQGAKEGHDPEFNVPVKWDVPLLEGYAWQEVPNRGSAGQSFFGLYNLGIWKLIREGQFDAVVSYVGYVRSTFWIARLAARLSGSAFLFGTDASSLAPRDSKRWKVQFKKIFWPYLFRMADQVFVPSTPAVELISKLGIAKERVTLTPFVVDNDWWTARAADVDPRGYPRILEDFSRSNSSFCFAPSCSRGKGPQTSCTHSLGYRLAEQSKSCPGLRGRRPLASCPGE